MGHCLGSRVHVLDNWVLLIAAPIVVGQVLDKYK